MNDAICGILLAAGGGRRMGQPKARVVVGAQTLLERGLTLLRESGCDPVIAVVAPEDADGLRHADVVINTAWQTGMASSFRAGLAAARGSAAVVALVDQPGITPEAVRRLIAAREPGMAVAATFGGAVRTPVLFDAALWPEVAAAVEGDAGARHWLRGHPARVIPVACDDIADPTDLDVPEDVTRWERECS
jgi:nicotine blue oxidoreductase